MAQLSSAPAEFAVYVQNTREGEAGDEYVCGARCRVDRSTESIVALPPEGGMGMSAALAHATAIAVHANHLVTHCEGKDLSSAMVAMAKALSGVPLRDRGGFYLLPPSTCVAWARMKPGLEALGVCPIRVEMHDAPDNVAAAQAAAKGALEADIGVLMADLEKASTEGMRQHAVVRRVEVCKELVAKADLFRGVLANVTDQITARVDELRRQVERHLDGDTSFNLAVNE